LDAGEAARVKRRALALSARRASPESLCTGKDFTKTELTLA